MSEKIAWFKVTQSVIGDYWQVRVRTTDGHEDTVDRAYTLEAAQSIWDHLNETMQPLEERPR